MNPYSFLENYGSTKTRVLKAVEALQQGKGILVTDDKDRENEGDLIFSTQYLTKEQIAQQIRDCSGIICLCLTPEKTERLRLPLMVENNRCKNHTNFTVSIEAAQGVTTGVSAADRLTTIKTACASDAGPEDIVSPGHVFPLKAAEKGLFERRGHTEATIDCMKLAGLEPSGVLCELTNPDGSMAKMPQISEYSEKYGLPIVSVEDLVIYKTNSAR